MAIFVTIGLLFNVAHGSEGNVFKNASLAGLVDEAGHTLAAQPYKGKYMLVLFGFTSCADVCPLTLLAMRNALNELGDHAENVVPIFVSVDPERDRGDRLRDYVSAFDARIRGLTGEDAVLQRLAADYGVFYAKRWVDASTGSYVYDHTASILLINPAGKLVSAVSSAGPVDEVASNIVAAYSRAE